MDRLVKENEQSEVNRNNMGMKVSGEKGETEGRKGPGCDDASGRVLLAVWLVLMPLPPALAVNGLALTVTTLS